MDKRKVWSLIKATLAATLATMTFAIGVCCYIYADLGSDSVTVFQQGLNHALKLNNLGYASYIYSISFLILDLFISRRNIGWATILNCFLLGSFINLSKRFLLPVFTAHDSMLYRIALLAAGILLISFSCMILIRTNRGKNVLDAVAWGISDKLHWPYRIARICVDAAVMLAGWLMGGVVWYGSIAAVFCTGPIIQFLNKAVDRLSKKKTGESA